MKRYTLILVVCMCLVSLLSAQDVIVMRNGDEIKAKVLEITINEIKYKRYDNPDSPTINIQKNDVFEIKYQNGTKQTFEKQMEPKHEVQQLNTKYIHHERRTPTYKNGIAINIEALFLKDFKLTYSHKLNNKLYFESMVSYNLPLSSNNSDSKFDIIGTLMQDPTDYYGRIQIRAGLKEYLLGRFYIGEMFLYNHGQFNDGYVTSSTNMFQESGYEYVNRTKNDYELLIKWGWTFQTRIGLLIDGYMGFGVRAKYLNDTVLAYSSEDDDEPVPYQGYPYHQTTNLFEFELHGGIQVGFGK